MKDEHFTQPKKFSSKTEKAVKEYLTSLGFDNRIDRGQFTIDKLRGILLENLEKYFKNEVSQDFVILLGTRLSHEFIGTVEDDLLLTVGCMIEDLSFLKPRRSKEKREKTLKSVLELLKKEDTGIKN